VPIVAPHGACLRHDDGVRPDSSEASRAKQKPVFERPRGQVTDGASWVLLASEDALDAHGLTPLAHRRQRVGRTRPGG